GRRLFLVEGDARGGAALDRVRAGDQGVLRGGGQVVVGESTVARADRADGEEEEGQVGARDHYVVRRRCRRDGQRRRSRVQVAGAGVAGGAGPDGGGGGRAAAHVRARAREAGDGEAGAGAAVVDGARGEAVVSATVPA